MLGEVRSGEAEPRDGRWTWQDTIYSGTRSGAGVIAVETCFIAEPADIREFARQQDPLIMLSWGHPCGLEYGTSPEAERDLREWLAVAADMEARRMRIVIAHPALRDRLWTQENRERSVQVLASVSQRAREYGLDLGIENHADLTAGELVDIIQEVGAPNLGVCLDLANTIRVGDDALDAARTLAPHVLAMHVKDVDVRGAFGLAGPPSVPLGTGSLPVLEALEVVIRHRPDAWLLVEIAQIEDPHAREEEWVSRDITWIRDVLNSMAPSPAGVRRP
jgi:sugar phosphate isomerase/epimerase